MIQGRATGFVLRTWPLRESDLIVSAFTLEDGKIRGVAHRAKRPKSPWAGALEPMTELTLHYRGREGQELSSFSEPSILCSPYHPSPPLEVNWTLAFIAELIEVTTALHDPDSTLYRLLHSSVEALLGGQDVFAVARYAQTWVLRIAGLLPELDACAGCDAELGEEGGTWHWSLHGFGCASCLDPERNEGGVTAFSRDLAWLAETRRCSPADVSVPDAKVLKRIGVLLGRVLGEHVGGAELKSERFLTELEKLS
jgi:DNA repair protein RecO (recombination protein O)